MLPPPLCSLGKAGVRALVSPARAPGVGAGWPEPPAGVCSRNPTLKVLGTGRSTLDPSVPWRPHESDPTDSSPHLHPPGQSTSKCGSTQTPKACPKCRPRSHPPFRARQPERQGTVTKGKGGGGSPWVQNTRGLPDGHGQVHDTSAQTPATPTQGHSLTSSHLRFPLGQVFRKHKAWRMLWGAELEQRAGRREAGRRCRLCEAPGWRLLTAQLCLTSFSSNERQEGGRAGGRRLAPEGRGSSSTQSARLWWPRAPATPDAVPRGHGRARCPSLREVVSCVLVPRARRHQGAQCPQLLQAPTCPTQTLTRGAGRRPPGSQHPCWVNPKTPA